MKNENYQGLMMMRLFNPINKDDEMFFKFDNLPANNPSFKDRVT